MESANGKMTREALAEQAGVIGWSDLQRPFARGVVIVVRPPLDWLEVALAMARNEADRLAGWMREGRVARATDDQARDWHARRVALSAVVVAPWVIVQAPAGERPDSGPPGGR